MNVDVALTAAAEDGEEILMLELARPHVRFHQSFLESHKEWDGTVQSGSGLRATDDVITPEGFAEWVEYLRRYEDEVLDPGYVTCTFRWVVDGDRYLGSIALRHELNDFLFERGGHIGYGIRPSARERGVGSWALSQTLEEARQRGLTRVLATCDEANVASQRTIESCGGVLEDIRSDGRGGAFCRYWFDLS